MNNIAIFWWAFNPPTLAHRQVIKEVLDDTNLQIDKIIICPDWDRLDKDYKINYNHRLNMMKIFIKDLKNNWYNIELDSYFLEWKNNTITSLLAVRKYFIEKLWIEPYHIFGSDVINWLNKWVGNENGFIEKQVKKIFISRPWYKLDTNNLSNFKITKVENMSNLSSSIVREMVKQKQNLNTVLNNEIACYIQKEQIYI